MKRKFIFLAMLLLTLIGGVNLNVLNAQEGQYRIKSVSTNKYLHIFNNDQHTSGAYGGVGVADYAESNAQIFTFQSQSTGYYLISADGYYIKCQDWNVDAYSTSSPAFNATVLYDFNFNGETFQIRRTGSNYLKVEYVATGSNYYVFSNAKADGSNGTVEYWVLEPVVTEDDVIPGAPTELTATEVTHNSVTLSWTAGTDARKYNVYRNGSLLAENIGATTYKDETVQPLTTYKYTVESVRFNDNVSTTHSNEFSVTTLKMPAIQQFEIADETTATSNYIPTNFYYNYSLTQQIYTAEQLGFDAGTISEIAFYRHGTGADRTRSIDVYMINTDKTSFDSNSDWVPMSASNKVYSGTFTGTTGNWSTIDISDFEYDGGNLLICIDDNTGSYSSNTPFKLNSTTTNTAIYIYNDGTNYDPAYPPTNATGRIAKNNQIKFTVELKPVVPIVDVNVENITFETPVRGGNYWSEKSGVQPIEVVIAPKGGAEVTNIELVDNTFFSIPTDIDLTANPISFNVSTGTSNEEGNETATLRITHTAEGGIIDIPVTAEVYMAAQGDAIENPFEVTFDENGSYTYTITSLDGFYDDYIFSENEQNDANCPDVVFELTIAEGEKALVGATNANCWISRYDGFTPENGPASKHDYPETEVLSAGTYYFVLAPNSWDLPFDFTITKTDVPAPIVTYYNPYDSAVNQVNPMLEWGMEYAEEYQLLLGTAKDAMEVVVNWTTDLATSYQTVDLQNNTQYFWQVNAKNEAGITTGEVYSFVTLLDVPAITSATAVNLYPGEATTITWDAVTNASSYKIYNGDNLLATLEPTVTSYELSGLAYNMNGHSITVTATQEGLGESLKSNAIIVKVAGEFSLVVSVKDSNGNPIEGATVSIDMTYAYDQFGRQVNAVNPETTVDGNATFTLPLLNNYTQYIVTATKAPYEDATKNIYYYDISNNSTYTCYSTLNLPKVYNLAVKNGDYVLQEDSELALTWDVVEGATAYKVYKNENLVETVTINEYTTKAEYDNAGSRYAVSAVFEGDLESDKTYTDDYIYVLGNGSFFGYVTDGTSPIANLTFKLAGTNAIGEDVVPLTTNAEGKFEGEVLEGNNYTLTISHYDYEAVVMQGIEINYNESNDLGTIVLTAKPSVKDITVTAKDKGEHANVTWTGNYDTYNVYRRNVENPQEVDTLAKVAASPYTDNDWADLEDGTYQYGVSTFVEEQAQSRGGEEVIYKEDFNNCGTFGSADWKILGAGGFLKNYGYVYSGYGYYLGGTNGTSTLTSNINIDLTKCNGNITLKFYNFNGKYESGIITKVNVKKTNENTWTTLKTISDTHTQFMLIEVDLSNYRGETIVLQFEAQSTGYGYSCIDEISIVSQHSAKESQIVWSDNLTKQAPNTFEGTVSTDWNTAANWSRNEVPEGADVIINANAVIYSDANVNVKNLNIKSGNLTIEGVLAVSGTLTNNGNLIINDGAELFQNNEDINATFNMSIISPDDDWESNNKKGWQFISSPFLDATVASFIPSEGEYDLYKYDGTQDLEWVNHKGGNSDEPGTGADTEFFFDFNDGSMEGLRVFQGEGNGEENKSANWQITTNGDTYYMGYDNTKGIYSYSWNLDDNEYNYPYNYVVTTQAYSITSASVLSWDMRYTYNGGAENDKYQVVASTDGVDFDVVVWEGTAADANENTISLAEYAGQTLYLGFYHYTIDQPGDAIVLDNIRLSSGSRIQTRGTSSFEDKFAQGVGYLASYEIAATVALNGELNPKTNKTWGQYYYNAEKDLANLRLLGNPFTFNMDMSKLSSYGMATGYAVVNENGEYEYKTDGIVNVGDGFFVKVAADYATLTYDHSYVAPVLRGSEKANSINVIASGKAGKDNVVVNFAGQAEGFNKLQNFNDAIATVYVSENGKNYGIANVDENTTEVALNFDAKEMGNYTISLDVNGEFETVTLVDRFTGVETNMLLEDEYTFTATSNDNVNRFVIRLANGQEPTANSQFVYQSGEELILSIEGSVQIVDMLGRVVYSNEHANGDNRISVSEFNNAAYVVRVVNEEGVKVQKVVIY